MNEWKMGELVDKWMNNKWLKEWVSAFIKVSVFNNNK